MLERTRAVLRGPQFGPETLPALRQLRPAAVGVTTTVVAAVAVAAPECSWRGVGVLGWGCDPDASFEEGGKDSGIWF